MFDSLITIILTALIGKKVPKYLIPLFKVLLQEAFKIVQTLFDRGGMTGEEKLLLAKKHLRTVLDEGLDEIPEWTKLSEEKRDVIVVGLIELAYFLVKLSKRGNKVDAEKLGRKLKRAAKKSRKVGAL